jgi:hypothetical protein
MPAIMLVPKTAKSATAQIINVPKAILFSVRVATGTATCNGGGVGSEDGIAGALLSLKAEPALGNDFLTGIGIFKFIKFNAFIIP